MAYVSLTSAQCDANSPLDETLMQQIRTNEDDLDARLQSFGTPSDQNIHDEFAGSVVDTDIWTADVIGAGTVVQSPTTHLVTLTAGGAAVGNVANILAATKKIKIRMTQTQSVTLKCRFKITTISQSYFIGWQTDGNTGGAADDTVDAVGIDYAAASQSVFRNSKGAATTTSAALGNVAAWQVLQIDLDQTGSALTLNATLDSVAFSGMPITTTNIPDTVTLYPVASSGGDGGSLCVVVIDYYYVFYNSQPLSA